MTVKDCCSLGSGRRLVGQELEKGNWVADYKTIHETETDKH